MLQQAVTSTPLLLLTPQEASAAATWPLAIPALSSLPDSCRRCVNTSPQMLLRKYPVTEHVSRTGLQHILRQELGRQLSGRFPDHVVQAWVEAGELGPQPHQPNPAVELSHSRSLYLATGRHLFGTGRELELWQRW